MLLSRQAVKRCFILPPHLTSAFALPGETKKRENHIFSLKYCITAFNQSLLHFFNFVDNMNVFSVSAGKTTLRV